MHSIYFFKIKVDVKISTDIEYRKVMHQAVPLF